MSYPDRNASPRTALWACSRTSYGLLAFVIAAWASRAPWAKLQRRSGAAAGQFEAARLAGRRKLPAQLRDREAPASALLTWRTLAGKRALGLAVGDRLYLKTIRDGVVLSRHPKPSLAELLALPLEHREGLLNTESGARG